MIENKLTGMENVNDYIELIKTPWGMMFYDLLYYQLDIPITPKLNILDFGSGLGVTSNHYAKWHNVTSIEPNDVMISNSIKENSYKQIHGGLDVFSTIKDDIYDVVLCHNVLEYIEDKKPVINDLLRVLKPGGILSLIKHNHAGKVFGYAVFSNEPNKALAALNDKTTDKINFIGKQFLYTNDDVSVWVNNCNCKVKEIFGIRTFYGLGQDNEIKYSDDWYQKMLELECAIANENEYKSVSYYNHLIIGKC